MTDDTGTGTPSLTRAQTLTLAASLSLGSAIALGLTRFAYALLLPSMKADLGWTFAQAGAMNTANALGYLLGALVFPLCARRWPAGTCFVAGCVVTALVMAVSGVISDTGALLAQRVATGVSSAFIFIGGGVLAARLASSHPRDAGLVLGLYYGGAGWGIVVSALLVPFSIRGGVHGWQWAWFALAAACAVLSVAAIVAARRIERGGAQTAGECRTRASRCGGRSDVAALRLCARRVLLLWRRVYRLHDVHHRALAQRRDERFGRDGVLCAARTRDGGLGAALVGAAEPHARRTGACRAQRPARVRDGNAGGVRVDDGCVSCPERCSGRRFCRRWHRRRRLCGTTFRPRDGLKGSALLRSCSRSGRSSGRWSSGISPMAPGSRGGSCIRRYCSRWGRGWRGCRRV